VSVRVLILTQYFPPEVGAPQTRLAAFARVLKGVGHQVEVVTAMPNHLTGKVFVGYRRRFYTEEVLEGLTIRRTWVYAATGTGLGRLLNYLSFTITSLIGLFRSALPDLIFVESPPLFLGISAIVFTSFRSVPIIFNVADLWPDSVRELGVVRNKVLLAMAEALERWIYCRARFVNAVTEGIRSDLIRKKSLPESKVLFLPNGVDTMLFAPREPNSELARRLGLEGKRVFIYAGTHGLAQGLGTLLDAAKMVKNRNVALLFVGDGPTKPALVTRVASLGLQNVVFVGMQPINVMPDFFSIAVASIAPLVKNELFKGARPSKIFPSLACGIPVIFCGEGETADLLIQHGAGLVVEPENACALAEAIERFADDDNLRKVLGANGRKLACTRFSWETIVVDWLEQLCRQNRFSLSNAKDQRLSETPSARISSPRRGNEPLS
jgi:colanic acid biosynthesis glycosyl transferase WcaI